MENVFSILFCLSLFYLAVTSRVKGYVTALQIQGLILTILATIPLLTKFSFAGIILPISLLLIKVILIPRYVNKIIIDLDIKRTIESTIQPIIFLLLVIFSMIVIFLFSNILAKNTELNVIPFASGFSTIITGIYVIMFRKTLIIHVAGFLIVENGIVLFGTGVASELPMIIELGVLLDIFVVVFLMGIALNKIRTAFEGYEVTHLGRLKD